MNLPLSTFYRSRELFNLLQFWRGNVADEFKNGAVPVRVGDGACQQPRPKAKPSTSPPSFCNTRLNVLQGVCREIGLAF